MELTTPVGWQQVPIAGSGGGHDGNTLFAYVFQMQILENHQNGKDTHLRGIKIYALDTDTTASGVGGAGIGGVGVDLDRSTRSRVRGGNPLDDEAEDLLDSLERRVGGDLDDPETWRGGDGVLKIPDFMKEPEIR